MIPGQLLSTYGLVDTGDATATLAWANGVAQKGQTATCTFNNNDPDGPASSGPTFQWIRGASTEISGATSSSYTATSSDVGTTIKCRVNYVDAKGFAEEIFTANSAVIANVVVGVFYLQDAAGVGSFNVPNYNVARIEVWGGGCGGSAITNLVGDPIAPSGAGSSSATSPGLGLSAGGGSPPTGGSTTTLQTQAAAATASGGNLSNASGGLGGVGQISSGGTASSGAGGNAPAGGAGGASVSHASVNGSTGGLSGAAPGAGGSGAAGGDGSLARSKGVAGGNSGAYSASQYTLGDGVSPSIGALFTCTVGAGSAGASGTFASGGPGANGRVRFTVFS